MWEPGHLQDFVRGQVVTPRRCHISRWHSKRWRYHVEEKMPHVHSFHHCSHMHTIVYNIAYIISNAYVCAQNEGGRTRKKNHSKPIYTRLTLSKKMVKNGTKEPRSLKYVEISHHLSPSWSNQLGNSMCGVPLRQNSPGLAGNLVRPERRELAKILGFNG